MKNLLRQLKFERFDRVINNFLGAIIIKHTHYTTLGDDIWYDYECVSVIYVDEESMEVEIDLGVILQQMNLGYERYIYDSIIKFVNKPTYKVKVIHDLYKECINIEEYEELITTVKI